MQDNITKASPELRVLTPAKKFNYADGRCLKSSSSSSKCSSKLLTGFKLHYTNPSVILIDLKLLSKEASNRYVKRDVLKHAKKKTQWSYRCSVCKKSFLSHSVLKKHAKTHTNLKRFECDLCESKFGVKDYLKKHMAIVHLRKNAQKCSVCSVTCVTKAALAVHYRIHSREKPYKCSECDRGFSHMSNMVTHVKTLHGNDHEKHFVCKYCYKKFSIVWQLTKHLASHTNDKNYKCYLCSKAFSYKSSMIHHVKTQHTNEKIRHNHNKVLALNSNLPSVHQMETEMKKPHKCKYPDCNQRFPHRSAMTIHVKRIHTKEKSFVCHFCNKAFVTASELNAHLAVHTKEKPYNCKHCKKSYLYQSSLAHHLQIHTEKNGYSCTNCTKKFRYKSNLNTHKKKYHSIISG